MCIDEKRVKVFNVFSVKLTRYLLDLGFDYIEKRPNYKEVKKDVYVFELTDSLQEAIDNYFNK